MKRVTLKSIVLTFYFIAICSIIFGIITTYYYPNASTDPLTGDSTGSTFNHVVGGDAYNYVIMGLRGLVWIVIGFISALIGSTAAILLGIHKAEEKKAVADSVQNSEMATSQESVNINE